MTEAERSPDKEDESETVESLARGVFISEAEAENWLNKWHPLLGASPRNAAATPDGARRVRQILNAIKHGGVA